jgi:hypothetical protein
MPSTQQSPPKPDLTPLEAVGKAGNGEVDNQVASKATEWFLSPVEQEVAKATIEMNVAGASQPEKFVPFVVQVVDRDRIRDLRREAERTNPDGSKEIDEMEANLQIVVEALLDPNLRDEKMRTVGGQLMADPADALRARFAHKPGLIDQLAGKIVQISGYNEGDVREVRAAGN